MKRAPTIKQLQDNDDHQNGNSNFSLLEKIATYEKDLERRQESYITRERAYRTRIDELEDELQHQRQEKTGWMTSDSKMTKLKNIQTQIISNVGLVQDRTAKILQEQERDLLRAFRARLFDVQTELEKEKSKKDDGSGAWIEKSRQLEAEVEWAKEVADRLERVNQTLLNENNRLKSQFSSQEEDRNFLIKQLVAVKKDNTKLRAEYAAMEAEVNVYKNQIKKQESDEHEGGAAYHKAKDPLSIKESEERYKDVNIRLRRLLVEERKALQQVRQNYAQELRSRTEMELLLRQCVEDVRKSMARKHVENAKANGHTDDLAMLYGKNPSLIPVEQFTQGDRERSLELLLSQERVLTLLYAKAFPIHSNSGSSALEPVVGLSDTSDLADSPSPSPSRPHTTGAAVGSDGKLPPVVSRPKTQQVN